MFWVGFYCSSYAFVVFCCLVDDVTHRLPANSSLIVVITLQCLGLWPSYVAICLQVVSFEGSGCLTAWCDRISASGVRLYGPLQHVKSICHSLTANAELPTTNPVGSYKRQTLKRRSKLGQCARRTDGSREQQLALIWRKLSAETYRHRT